MSSAIIELTQDNFNQLLAEESFKKPVLIDFWAEWCAPCKAMMPVFETLAVEFSDHLIFTKLDTEAQPEIAAQFGIRNIPTVAVIKDGRPVDHFSGAIPESEIRTFLEKFLPKAWEESVSKAEALVAEEKYVDAVPYAKLAFELSAQLPEITKFYVQVLILAKRISDAETILATIGFKDQDQAYQSLLAQIDLAKNAAETPEIANLIKSLEADPDNGQLKFELALQYNQTGKVKEGMQLLIDVLTLDMNFKDGEAKKTLLEMIQSVGSNDPLAAEFQRKLFTLMY